MSIGEPRVSIAPPPLESWFSAFGAEAGFLSGILMASGSGVVEVGCNCGACANRGRSEGFRRSEFKGSFLATGVPGWLGNGEIAIKRR